MFLKSKNFGKVKKQGGFRTSLLKGKGLVHLFIYFSFSKIIQKFKIYIYIHTHTQTHTHMHAYAYICVSTVYAYACLHIYIIIYISTAILGENRNCRRLRVLSSSPENIPK